MGSVPALLPQRGLPLWPRGKPLPKFKGAAAERVWWETYDMEPPAEADFDVVEYEPRATMRPLPSLIQ